MSTANYYDYETLRPDQLEVVVGETPVVYWPLGLLEHHGWHLPIGFDGIKARRLCKAAAARTGGVILPVMWWGGGGGHGGFKWTHYQDEDGAGRIVYRTIERLAAYGFRIFVLLCGHYPWEGILKGVSIESALDPYPGSALYYGTEVSIAQERSGVPNGDHAARQETNYGLALLPEYVSLDSLTPGRSSDVWAPEGVPQNIQDYPDLNVDPAGPRFAQLGEDPALSSTPDGVRQSDAVVTAVSELVAEALGTTGNTSDNDGPTNHNT